MPVTDEQIVNFLALGSATDPIESRRRHGQSVWDTAKALGVTVERVHQVLRSPHWTPSGTPGWSVREEVDRRFQAGE